MSEMQSMERAMEEMELADDMGFVTGRRGRRRRAAAGRGAEAPRFDQNVTGRRGRRQNAFQDRQREEAQQAQQDALIRRTIESMANIPPAA